MSRTDELNNGAETTYGEDALIAWQRGGMGSFSSALWKAITTADSSNLRKLEKGYPSEVQAYRNYGNLEGFSEALRNKGY